MDADTPKTSRRRGARQGFEHLVLIGLLSLVAAPSATAKTGALDKSFSTDGRVRTGVESPAGLTTPWDDAPFSMVESANGTIVAARRDRVLRYLPNGQLDSSFGSVGRIVVGEPAGLPFQIADLDVDSQGRLVVAGTSTDSSTKLESSTAGEGPRSQELATIVRYLPSGTLDASFGGGDGVILSTFGQPPAPEFNRPSVVANDILIDDRDRVLLAGNALGAMGFCKTLKAPSSQAFVARLKTSGEIDPSFGSGGIGATDLFEAIFEMAVGPTSGEIVLLGSDSTMCGGSQASIARLGSEGGADAAFGIRYFERDRSLPAERDYSLRSPRRVSIDGQGRILVLGSPMASYLPGGRKGQTGTRMMRLRPSGRRDESFGQRGKRTIWLPGPGSYVAAFTPDSRDGIFLAGAIATPPPEDPHWPPNRSLVAVRVRPSGKIDRAFGDGGRVVTSFGRGPQVVGYEALIDSDGRLLVGGPIWGTGSQSLSLGVALARYRVGG